MLPQSEEPRVNSQSPVDPETPSQSATGADTPSTSDGRPLVRIFEEMSEVSDDVNRVLIASDSDGTNDSSRTRSTFEALQMLTEFSQPAEPPVVPRKRARPTLILNHNVTYDRNEPKTPWDNKSRWGQWFNGLNRTLPSSNMPPSNMPTSTIQLPPLLNYPMPSETELMTEEELVRMKGPSRLIGFLVDIAMKERARTALRWTGNGLEFILVNKELVAKMWGNRKHNTKDMDYYKLSRAIREKYDKKEKNSVTRTGKLKKGSRTYSYVFTENAYTDLMSQTERTIEFIQDFANRIGNKYRDNNDINTNSPQAPSPQNSDE